MRSRLVIGALTGALCSALPSYGTQYAVSIDTTAVHGTAGAVVFDLTSNASLANSVSILDFSHDGMTGLPETRGGLVEGDIILLLNPAPSTRIGESGFFNELKVPFVRFGTQVTFTLSFTDVGPAAGGRPDQLSFFLTDSLGRLLPTADPLGAAAMFAVSINGSVGGLLEVFSPAVFAPADHISIAIGGSCSATPLSGCRQPVSSAASSVRIRNRQPDTHDSLAWDWRAGAATATTDFGDPTAGTSYRVCIYDMAAGTPKLQMNLAVAGGVFCGAVPCWSSNSAGFRYRNRDATPSGIRSVKLRAGADGSAQIRVRGRGPDLNVPPLPLMPKVIVQMNDTSNSVCWDATYSTPQFNTSAQFVSRSD